MLLTHDKWAFFTKKPIVDARHQSEVIVRRTAPPARRPRTDGQQTDPGQAHRGREGREIETAVPPAERRHAAARRGHASPSTLFAANHADATARLSRRARRARPWPCSIRCPRRKTNCRSSRRDKGEDRGRRPVSANRRGFLVHRNSRHFGRLARRRAQLGLRTEFRPFSRVLRLNSPAGLSRQNSVSRTKRWRGRSRAVTFAKLSAEESNSPRIEMWPESHKSAQAQDAGYPLAATHRTPPDRRLLVARVIRTGGTAFSV